MPVPPSTGDEIVTDLESALLRAEEEACEAIYVTPASKHARAQGRVVPVATAADAIRAAALDGRRSAVLVGAHELLGGVEALAEAAARRAPLVVHALVTSAGHAPGRHELAAVLDLGAAVLVGWGVQDGLDLALAAHRAAEDSETTFLVLHDVPGSTATAVRLPPATRVREFLAADRGEGRQAALDRPPVRDDGDAQAQKRAERTFASRVPFALTSALRELGDRTGRPLAVVERTDTADADEILVAVGAAYPPAVAVARAMRADGRRVGVVGLRALRPFLGSELVKVVARARVVAVLEPLDVALAPCGPVASSLKAAFADALTWAPGYPGVGRVPPVVSAAFATIDGAIGEGHVREALAELAAGDRAKRLLVFGSDFA